MFFKLTTELYCEKNCIISHSGDIAAIGTKAYIITGRNSSKKNGSLDDTIKALTSNNIEYMVFDGVTENPSIENVMEAVNFCNNFTPDMIIGIGGGSPLDAAKAVSLVLANPDKGQSVLLDTASAPYLPVVTIPTTCGTGSEITPYSVLTLHSKKTKSSIPHKIYPALALIDPSYLKYAPVSVIRNTAVDALGHLIESYIHSKATTISRMFSEKGLKLWRNIATYISNDTFTDQQYEELIIASAIAGMAISHTGTSLPHRMSYHFTYTQGIPHGMAVGAFLAAYTAHADKQDRDNVLNMLGIESCDALKELIIRLTGSITMDSVDYEYLVNFILDNKVKLASCPYEVDRQIVMSIYNSSLNII